MSKKEPKFSEAIASLSEKDGDLQAEIERLNLSLAEAKFAEGVVCPYCSHCGNNMLHKLERLQAIVDQLTKTNDGVPIVPNMTLFVINDGKILEVDTYCTYDDGSFGVEVTEPMEGFEQEVCVGGGWEARDCFSTREAAEAARVKG